MSKEKDVDFIVVAGKGMTLLLHTTEEFPDWLLRKLHQLKFYSVVGGPPCIGFTHHYKLTLGGVETVIFQEIVIQSAQRGLESFIKEYFAGGIKE